MGAVEDECVDREGRGEGEEKRQAIEGGKMRNGIVIPEDHL
tara:strand:+ start:427 stop:549 length:123 start_codon:yes stop_codon:yes gene_type:complete